MGLRLFVFLLGVFATWMAKAQNPLQWAVQTRLENQFIIEVFQRAADGWQDRVSRLYFTNAQDVRDYLTRNEQQYLVSADQEFLDLVDLPQSQSFAKADGDAAFFFSHRGQELKGAQQKTWAASKGLWDAEHPWDLGWEQKFSAWISSQVDEAFFQKYNISTDCADVAYALRWIFARENKLEMASRLSGSGDYFTHRSLRAAWASLPTAAEWHKDRRFLAALNYMLVNTYTHSLMADSYPIQITRVAIAPGVYHLDLFKSTGHTQVIYRTDEQPGILLPFLVIQSTVPRQVRALSVQGFWYGALPKENKAGLLRMRWPVFKRGSVTLQAAALMPYSSKEQYAADFPQKPGRPYNQEVYLRLNPQLDFQKVIVEALKSIQAMFLDRIQVVNEGFEFCQKNNCATGTSGYEDWSTPTRDQRILDLDKQIQLIAESVSGANTDAETVMTTPFLNHFGELYSLKALLVIWRGGAFSSVPTDVPEKRWGLQGQNFADWSMNEFKRLARERETLLSSKKSADAQDVGLQKLRKLVGDYSVAVATTQAVKFNGELENSTLLIAEEILPIRKWFSRIPFFVSDLAETKARQWGRHSKDLEWLDASGEPGRRFSQAGWMLSRMADAWKVQRQGLGGAVGLKSGASKGLVELISETSTLVEVQGTELTLHDLERDLVSQINLDFSPTHVKVLPGGFLLQDQKTTRFALASLMQKDLEWLDQGYLSWIDLTSATTVMFGTPNSPDVKIWDFLDPRLPRAFAVTLPGPASIKANTKAWLAIAGLGFFNKTSAVLAPNPRVDEIYFCHSSGAACLVMISPNLMSFELSTVDTQGQLRPVQTMTGWINTDGLVLTHFEPGGSSEHYRWTELGLVTEALKSDERTISQIAGEYIVAGTVNGKFRLRRGNRTLFETTGTIFMSLSQRRQRDFFYTVPQNSSVLSLRAVDEPDVPLSSMVNGFQWSHSANITSGTFTMSDIWLK